MKFSEIISSVINGIDYVQNFEPRMKQMVRKEVKYARRALLQTSLQIFFFLAGGLMLLIGLVLYLANYVATEFALLIFGLVFLLLGLIVGWTIKK